VWAAEKERGGWNVKGRRKEGGEKEKQCAQRRKRKINNKEKERGKWVRKKGKGRWQR